MIERNTRRPCYVLKRLIGVAFASSASSFSTFCFILVNGPILVDTVPYIRESTDFLIFVLKHFLVLQRDY